MSRLRLLFYGALDSHDSAYADREQLVRAVVRECAMRSWQIVTREGERRDFYVQAQWRAVDNVVLDEACEARDTNGLASDAVVSFAEVEEHNAGKVSEHNRPIRVLPVPDRLSMYTEMLSQVDALVTVGGREGVARIGIVARLVRKPIIPLLATGGASARIYRDIVGRLQYEESHLAHEYVAAFGCAVGTLVPSDVRKIADTIETVVRRASEATPAPVLDVGSMKLGDFISSMTLKETAAIIGGLVTLLAAVFGVGYFFGGL